MEEDMRDATELSEPGSVRIETDYVPGKLRQLFLTRWVKQFTGWAYVVVVRKGLC